MVTLDRPNTGYTQTPQAAQRADMLASFSCLQDDFEQITMFNEEVITMYKESH